MIAEHNLPAVKNTLQIAFGVSDFEDCKELTTGLSNALVYRIVVHGKPYLLKIARTDTLQDPTLSYYSAMKAAAEAGIAPKVYYAGVEDAIHITDYIELAPFPLTEANRQLAPLLKRLHSLPLFAKTIHSIDTAVRFAKMLQQAAIVPEAMATNPIAALNEIAAIYPRSTDELVSSHNDLKPENILFDGTRPWLSDWEAAFNNDRYSDLSIVANFTVASDDDEIDLLSNYFGRQPSEYERARFYLMRQVMHVSYFAVFLVVVHHKKVAIDIETATKHDFRDFHNKIWAGEMDLTPEDRKIEYALVHLNEVTKNIATPRFKQAMELVSSYGK